jgi:hypothetical protein
MNLLDGKKRTVDGRIMYKQDYINRKKNRSILHTIMDELYSLELGNNRKLRIVKEDIVLSIIIRQIEDEFVEFPAGIRLNVKQWRQLQLFAENASKALKDVEEGNTNTDCFHELGEELYVQVHSPFKCATIRKFVSAPYYDRELPKPHCPVYNGRKLCPTKDGISHRPLEWLYVREHMGIINEIISQQSVYAGLSTETSQDCIVQQCNCLTVKNHGLSEISIG